MWLSEFYTFAKAIYCLSHTLVCSVIIHIRQKEKIPDFHHKCQAGFNTHILYNTEYSNQDGFGFF